MQTDNLVSKDLSEDQQPAEVEETELEKQVKQILQELAAQKREIEHIKKILARR